ncbi:hypothetical protein QR680_009575 [Steinernema hermaphroditum]|uniref:Integrator complex subunit 4/Protein SIEL C-terminal Ig-like domain-containing protein n=1 Tax=Steinernema hermaphroditum TaxID=289476 RepID=A0AA39M9P7_9BILA|nr:hypothetical protein QR680_009575 [Steinernema hermaphroditum]
MLTGASALQLGRKQKRECPKPPVEEPPRKREAKGSKGAKSLLSEVRTCVQIREWVALREHLAGLQVTHHQCSAHEEICFYLASSLESMPQDIVVTALSMIESQVERSQQKAYLWEKFSVFKMKNQVDTALFSLYTMLLQEKVVGPQNCENTLSFLWRNIRTGTSNQRIYAIKFLITYTLAGGSESGDWNAQKLERELGPFCEDRDYKVRGAAIDGFVALSEDERGLSFDCYSIFTRLAENADMIVRIKCLRLIQYLASKYGNRDVKSAKGILLPVNDDAFSIICNAINDSEIRVRAEAAKLLGKFVNVSENFLMQTLDKKIMVKMRLRKDGTSCSGYSEWATGKKLGEDVPAERAEEDAQSIISTGACGAFVTALEDEFMAVRQAAVYSLGRLAVDRPTFANACIEHLADMFNDEIEEIRLDAIKALTPLVVHGTLQKYQLPTILNVLDDAAQESRFALHELLGKSNLYDPECLEMCVKALLHSLKRYPLDQTSTYRCLSRLGTRHAVFVQCLLDNLLELHAVFDTPEQTVDDPFYVAKLMLVLNAASVHSVIYSLVPSYVIRHYRYLRSCYPHLIAPVKEIERARLISSSHIMFTNDTKACEKIGTLLDNTYNRMAEVQKSERSEEKESAYFLIVSDLEALEEAEPEVAVPARFMKIFFDITRLGDYTRQIVVYGGDYKVALLVIEQSLDRLDSLQYQFSQDDTDVQRFIGEYRFYLVLQYLALKADNVNRFRPEEVVAALKEAVTVLQKHVIMIDSNLTNNTHEIVVPLLQHLHQHNQKPEDKPISISGRSLVGILSNYNIPLPKHFKSLRKVTMKTVEILEPTSEWIADNVVKFVSNLPTGIAMTAMLYNFEKADLHYLRIRVVYPDKVVAYLRPRPSDIISTGPHTYRLSMTVLVSANAWSDAAEVDITCGLFFLKRTQAIKKETSFFVPLPDHKKPSSEAVFSVKVHPKQKGC